nr:MAG TPA: hypothetical protein [Caudoviricetes sp.]
MKKRNRKPVEWYLLDFDFKFRDGTWCHCVEVVVGDKSYKVVTKAGMIWFNIKQRTRLGSAYQKNKPTYAGVKNCFKDFQDFCDFCQTAPGYHMKDKYGRNYALDKDILNKSGRKEYSRDTCCFVPLDVNNMLLTRRGKKASDYPPGIRITPCKKYEVRDGRGKSKSCNTLEEAIAVKNKLKAERILSKVKDGYLDYDQRIVSRRVEIAEDLIRG